MSKLTETWDYSDSYQWMDKARGGFGPVIITCAVCGGVQGKEAHSALPETPTEIAQAAYEAYNAGATAVHIHGRSPDNWAECTNDPDVYREINALVREKCPDIIINNTTGGGMGTTMEGRLACLDARPEMASLNLGPDMSRLVIPERPAPLPHPHPRLEVDDCIPFTYGIIEGLAQKMKRNEVKPEMEIYHPGQYWVARDLMAGDLVNPPYVFQMVMGYQTSIYPTPQNLLAMVRELPAGSVFFAFGIGHFQLPMTTLAMLVGGHVRVGLEDNLYHSKGRKFAGNGEAVERAARIARELNREVATPAQAREILGLSPAPRAYDRPEPPLVIA
ncbi:MAG: 3-keto-5-aminohexanoate cleavage protein [Actinomycetota bacterium]